MKHALLVTFVLVGASDGGLHVTFGKGAEESETLACARAEKELHCVDLTEFLKAWEAAQRDRARQTTNWLEM